MSDDNPPTVQQFTYSVSWSEQDGEYVGACLEFPSLSHLAADPEAALAGVRLLVADASADMLANNEPMPSRPAGMRLLQLWVPDTRTPAFAAEAARQSKLGEWDRSPAGRETMDWIMRNSVLSDDAVAG